MPQGEFTTGRVGGGGPGRLSKARERIGSFLLKPPDPAVRAETAPPRTVEELRHVSRFADDKERLIGLVAAPVGAVIALLVTGALMANDPAARLKDGLANVKHVNPSLYGELMLVLLALCMAMVGTAWFRKRLLLGCAMALYGLAVFNLHYWGFGVPYVLFGAWLLVRAYRAQRDLREATGVGPSRFASGRAATSLAAVPAASKRYTPPARPGGSRRAGEKRAG